MVVTEKRLNEIISNSIKKMLSELTGIEMRVPKRTPGSDEERRVLELVGNDTSKEMIRHAAKTFSCSMEAIETVLRRHGLLPKFGSTRNLFLGNKKSHPIG